MYSVLIPFLLAVVVDADEINPLLNARQTNNVCAQVTAQCTAYHIYKAESFCRRFLPVPSETTTSTYTVTSVHTYASTTRTKYHTYSPSCPQDAPPTATTTTTATNAKRALTPSPQSTGEYTKHLPTCLSAFTTAISELSSACHCYYPTGFTTTTTEYSTVTAKDATTSTYSTTKSFGTVLATPTCQVTYTNYTTGKMTPWNELYHLCHGSSEDEAIGFYYLGPSTEPLCDALNDCVGRVVNQPTARGFELSKTVSGAWYCFLYNSLDTTFFTYDSVIESYGYIGSAS